MKRPRIGRPDAGRLGLTSVALVLALGGAACEGEDEGEEEVEDLTIVVEADKSRILEEEQALSNERVQVETERERLARERDDVSRKLASLSKKDRKSREKLEAEKTRIDGEQQRLRDRAKKFEQERSKLDQEKSELLERISSMTKRGKGGLTVEQREASMARREKDLAAREESLAKREARVAAREAESTKTLKDLNSVLAGLGSGGVTKTVIVNSGGGSSAGGAATRSQAAKAQKAVRQRMDNKGILMDDLPPTAKSLFKQGAAALGSKEFGDAAAAFDQVLGIVDGITVNQSFVQGKMARLARVITQKELDDKKKQRVQGLLAEVSDAAADGRYDKANKKANQIALVLRSN